MDKPGLYIHIPFCFGKCPYCDFYSEKLSDKSETEYCRALCDELKTHRRVSRLCDGFSFEADTVYFGGGTPSLMSHESFTEIFSALHKGFSITPDAEITVECNPSGNPERLFSALRSLGVNRISLGLQSACENERKRLGRRSSPERVHEVIHSARKHGIDNISLDVMLGIPEQTTESLEKTLSFCAISGVEHISAYILKIEQGTPFYRMGSSLVLPDEDDVCDMYEYTVKRLGELGYAQYEISNFSLPGKESRHNMKYWKLIPYLGIGPAAHSFVGGKRFFFPADTKSFIEGVVPTNDGTGGDMNEYIMLGLRLTNGIDLEQFRKQFGNEHTERLIKKALPFAGQHLAAVSENNIHLTAKGFLVSNSIISELTL